jgi:putative transcriptional regulator
MNKIAFFRRSVGLTQKNLAMACDWSSQSRIAQYENEDRTPNIDDCKKIANALNGKGLRLTLEDIFPPYVA